MKRSRGTRRTVVMLVLLSVLLTTVLAAEHSEEEVWVEVATANFVVFGDAPSERVLEVARRLELFRSVFAHLSPALELDSPAPIKIYAFRDGASFAPFRAGPAPESGVVLGQFTSHPDGNYLTIDTGSRLASAYSVVLHELVHYFVKCNFPAVPLWLNEGLAEYYSSFRLDDDRVHIGEPVDRHISWFRSGGILDLAELMSPEARFQGEHRGRQGFYAGSWVLVHYLLSSGAERSNQLAELLLRGREGRDQQALFEEVFGASIATFETEINELIAAGEFPSIVVDLPESTAIGAEIHLMIEADIDFELADLAMHVGANSLAKEKFYEALASDSFHSPALAGLAFLLHLEDRADEAEVLFEEAIELGLDIPLSYLQLSRYWIAQAQRTDDRREKDGADPRAPLLAARAAAERVIELDGSYAEGRVVAGLAELMLGENLERSAELLRSAYDRLPWRRDVVVLLISAELRRGELDVASNLVENVLTVLADPEEVDSQRREIQRARLLREARAAMQAGDSERAAELFDRAIDLTEDREIRHRMETRLEALSGG